MEVIGGYKDGHLHVEPAGNAPRSMVDMFSDQFKGVANTLANATTQAGITAVNPTLGAIYGSLADKGDNDSPFAIVENFADNWPRVVLIGLGGVILTLGIVALIVNSGSKAANVVMQSDTGKSIARAAKVAALV